MQGLVEHPYNLGKCFIFMFSLGQYRMVLDIMNIPLWNESHRTPPPPPLYRLLRHDTAPILSHQLMNILIKYRIVPNRSAVPNRRAPPFLKEKYAHIFLTWTKINLNLMLKSTQWKNLRIYFSFPQSLTEHIINYCKTDLLLQWNLWSGPGDTSAPQQKCPTDEVSPHHMDPLKRVETSGHNKTCWCRQVDF